MNMSIMIFMCVVGIMWTIIALTINNLLKKKRAKEEAEVATKEIKKEKRSFSDSTSIEINKNQLMEINLSENMKDNIAFLRNLEEKEIFIQENDLRQLVRLINMEGNDIIKIIILSNVKESPDALRIIESRHIVIADKIEDNVYCCDGYFVAIVKAKLIPTSKN